MDFSVRVVSEDAEYAFVEVGVDFSTTNTEKRRPTVSRSEKTIVKNTLNNKLELFIMRSSSFGTQPMVMMYTITLL